MSVELYSAFSSAACSPINSKRAENYTSSNMTWGGSKPPAVESLRRHLPFYLGRNTITFLQTFTVRPHCFFCLCREKQPRWRPWHFLLEPSSDPSWFCFECLFLLKHPVILPNSSLHWQQWGAWVRFLINRSYYFPATMEKKCLNVLGNRRVTAEKKGKPLVCVLLALPFSAGRGSLHIFVSCYSWFRVSSSVH